MTRRVASIGYNPGYMIFCGTSPMVVTYLVSATGSDAAPAMYLIAVENRDFSTRGEE